MADRSMRQATNEARKVEQRLRGAATDLPDDVERLKTTPQFDTAVKFYGDPEWRLDNLYSIVDERGSVIPFKRNPAQRSYWKNRHSRDVLPKARKLGFSTLIEIAIIDYCMFHSNITAGIVDDTIDDAKVKLDMIGFAYDHLDADLRKAMPMVKRNTEEIHWANGSNVSVGTSFRGGTPQIIHSSELGKTSVNKPDQAREFRLGTLAAVPQNGWVVIESTAHGTAGEFYNYVREAEKLQALGRQLSPLEMRLHFYGWWMKTEYRVPNHLVVLTQEVRDYFAEVDPKLKALHGVALDANQKAWYQTQHASLGPDDVKSEFPTLMEETFFSSKAGTFWRREIAKARADKRIGLPVPFDPTRRVNTWWDIGEDCTAVVFHQTDGVRNRLIDYYEEEGGSLQRSIGMLWDKQRERGFQYGVHLGPHDLDNREWGNNAQSRYKTALDLGIRFTVVPRVPVKDDSIEAARRLWATTWVDEEYASLIVTRCENYAKKWNKTLGVFTSDPVHGIESHCADAIQQGAMGMHLDPMIRVPSADRSRPRGEPRRASPWSA